MKKPVFISISGIVDGDCWVVFSKKDLKKKFKAWGWTLPDNLTLAQGTCYSRSRQSVVYIDQKESGWGLLVHEFIHVAFDWLEMLRIEGKDGHEELVARLVSCLVEEYMRATK